MFFSKTFYPLLTTGLTQEDPSWYSVIVDLDVNNQNKQTNKTNVQALSMFVIQDDLNKILPISTDTIRSHPVVFGRELFHVRIL